MQIFGYDVKLKKSNRSRDRHRHHVGVDFYAPSSCLYRFAESEVLSVEKMISSRLGNAVFDAKIDFLACKDIFKFLHENRLQIIRRLFDEGYFIINTVTMEFVHDKMRKTIKLMDGRICFELCDDEVLYTSETFEATGQSDRHYILDKLRFLDVVNSSDLNLIENYGAMGIVSPESDNSVAGAEFDDDDIKELQDRYNRSYGIRLGKWSLMFVPRPTRYSPIALPISQLQLSDKRLYLIKSIYAAFGVPKELSVYFENSKYSNRNEAELDMYSSCVKSWANILLEICKKIYHNKQKRESYLMPNEFWYDFIGVPALQETRQTERVAAREEFAFWQSVKATMPEYEETANKRIESLIENL